MTKRLLGLFTLATLAAGCGGGSEGTYLIVDLRGNISAPRSIDIDLMFNGATASRHLDPGGAFQLPKTAVFHIVNGEGPISVTARANDPQGAPFATATGSGTIVKDETTTVVVDFGGNTNVDGGPDGQTGMVVLEINPSNNDFGSVVVNSSGGTATFTVTNTGTLTSGLLTTAKTGSDAAAFPIMTDGCMGMVLAPNNACTVTVAFMPTSDGAKSATLTVSGGTAMVSAGLMGTALTAGQIMITPGSADFRSVTTGSTSAPVVFTVTNMGGSATGALTTTITGSGMAAYTMSANGCNGMTLAPSASCMVSVAFAPTATGMQTATLLVNASPGGNASASLMGTGITGAAIAITMGASHDFGTVNVGAASPPMVTVRISNSGQQATGALTTTIGASTQYSVTNGCTGQILNGSATCDIVVTFRPIAFGTHTLPIMVAGTPGGSVMTTLTGVGRDFVAITINTGGTGTGSVSAVPAGVMCTANTCQYPRTSATSSVMLTATPDATSTFGSWTGACTGTNPMCTITLSGAQTTTANFTIKTFQLTLSKTVVATGTGTVTSSPGGISCGTGCPSQTATFNAGTVITLTANPGANFWGGWGGGCSGFLLTCQITLSANTTVNATFSGKANTVFVTSLAYSLTQLNNLGTGATMTARVLSGANTACNNAAAGKTFAGNYVAWLSTLANSAVSRLGTARGWVRPDGKPFADGPTEMTAGNKIYYPAQINENGSTVTVSAWTGTQGNGTAANGYNCNDWSSVMASDSAYVGFMDAGPLVWTAGYNFACNTSQNLICFQTDFAVAVPPPPVPAGAKIMFASNNPWDPSRGLTNADSLCNTEASLNPALSGRTFAAILATSTASPASRFTPLNGALVVRPDGITIIASDNALFADGVFQASPSVTSDGQYVGPTTMWSGATGMNQPNSIGPGYTCNDWASLGSPYGGIAGNTSHTSRSWYNQGTPFCNASGGHIYCLQR